MRNLSSKTIISCNISCLSPIGKAIGKSLAFVQRKNVSVFCGRQFPWEIVSSDYNSSVIRQKGESQNGCLKKTRHAKFSKKRIFLTPCVSGGKKCSFFGKFGGALFSLNTRFEIRPFALLPTNYVFSFATTSPRF